VRPAQEAVAADRVRGLEAAGKAAEPRAAAGALVVKVVGAVPAAAAEAVEHNRVRLLAPISGTGKDS
jgi:hypothetical protein